MAARIGYRNLKKHGPDAYWQGLFSGNEADQETAKELELLSTCATKLEQHSGVTFEPLLCARRDRARDPRNYTYLLRTPRVRLLPLQGQVPVHAIYERRGRRT